MNKLNDRTDFEDHSMSRPTTILLLLKRVDCNDGVASYLETLITGLREVGDRVLIVSGEVTTLYGSEVRRNSIQAVAAKWIVLDSFNSSRPRRADIRTILSLIRDQGVDVVSPQGFGVLPLGYLVGRLSGLPVVTNYHPSLQGDEASIMSSDISTRKKIAFQLVTTICRSDRYIALSTEIADFFKNACRIPLRRIHKQMLGVETDFYRAPSAEERRFARARLELDEAAFVAVLPGRMNLSKGHDIAAAAFRELRARRPNVSAVCLFPGGGDQQSVIQSSVLKNDADKATFRFLGFVERNVLRDAYWAADVVLLPSRKEGFGLVVAEAMCCGAIAIRTPSGGWQDQIIEGETGYVVPFNDPAALAIAIEKVMDSPSRARMRERAMLLASSSFAKSRMIEGTSTLYREIADTRRLHRRTVLPPKTA